MRTKAGEKKGRTKNVIPRPKNSFMTYRQEKQDEIISTNGRINNTVISKIAGEMWRNEKEDTKSMYRFKAEIGKEEHKRMYPDYKYSPKKPQKQRKQRKSKFDKLEVDLHKSPSTGSFDKVVEYMKSIPSSAGSEMFLNTDQPKIPQVVQDVPLQAIQEFLHPTQEQILLQYEIDFTQYLYAQQLFESPYFFNVSQIQFDPSSGYLSHLFPNYYQ